MEAYANIYTFGRRETFFNNIHLRSSTAQPDNADAEEGEMDNFPSFTSKLPAATATRQTDHEKNGELTHSCSNN